MHWYGEGNIHCFHWNIVASSISAHEHSCVLQLVTTFINTPANRWRSHITLSRSKPAENSVSDETSSEYDRNQI